MVKSSPRYNSNSDLIRCAGQIKAMGFSLFIFVIALIIFSTIPITEFKKMYPKLETTPTTVNTNEVPPSQKAIELLPETINKFIAISILLFLGLIIFITSIIVATSKGCYKTSIFGLLFGLLFGII